MSRRDPSRPSLLSAAAYAGMFVFGIVMALLGAILPALVGRLEFEVADIGALFLAMNAAMLVASFLLGPALDHFGMKLPLALGPVLVAAALVVVSAVTALSGLFLAVLLLGIGGGVLNGAANTLVADLHADQERKNAALNRLGVFFGFGALLMPFAIGTLLVHFPFAALLLAGAGLCGVAAVYASVLRFPEPKQGHRLPASEVPRFIREPLVRALAFLLFFESGVEFTVGGFVSLYLTRDLGASVSFASWVLAGYWAAVMVTRLVLSHTHAGARPYRLLGYCAAGALAGAVVTSVAQGPAEAAFGVVFLGASLAGIFPAVLGIAGVRFETHSGTVFGILLAIALSGGMILPWVAGQIGSGAGLRWVFVLVAGAYATILGLSRVAARLDRAPGAA